MFNLQANKAVVGSANTQIYEDPVVGSNGTAVLLRYNNLIDSIEEAFTKVLPTARGSLITIDINSNPYELAKGLESYCLVVDNGSTSGLSYRERVDLTSNQSIGGLKTFTGITTLSSGFISNAASSINAGLTVTGNLSSGPAVVNGNFNAKGNSIFDTNATIAGLTSTSSLQVTNASILGGGFTSNANSIVNGDLIVDRNLVVDQAIKGQSLTVNSLSIPGLLSTTSSALTITGSLNTNSLVTGTLSSTTTTISGPTTIANTLDVAQKLDAGSLEVDTTVLVGGSTTLNGQLNTKAIVTVGNITVTGSMNLSSQLIVGGSTNLQTLTSTIGNFNSINVSTTGFINTLESNSLETNSVITSSLVVTGSSSLEDVEAQSLNVSSIQSSTSSIGVAQGSSLTLSGALSSSSLTISGNTSLSTLSVSGTTNANQVNISNNLSVIGNGVINNLEVKGDLLVKDDCVVDGDQVVIGTIQASNLTGTNTGDEGEATPTALGVVRVNINEVNPIVYTKTSIDLDFIRLDSKGVVNGVAPLNSSNKIPSVHLPYIVSRYVTTFNESNRVNNKVLIEHLLNTRTPASIGIWNDQYERIDLPIRSTTLDHIEIDIANPIVGEWTIKILN